MAAIDINVPLVTICCVTYNHERFIRQCLDGFLIQQTTFKFEVLVHEDASTDNTAAIVREYQSKHPSLFKCIFQSENQFLKQNVLTNILFPMSRGKYLALCEGDDYWTDPNKLQKQVDFLEAHPEYIICYHRVNILNEQGELIPEIMNSSSEPRSFELTDLAIRRNIIHTPSVLFRNRAITLPDWFSKSPIGDYVLHVLHARKGKIYYLPDIMAVYRIHNNSFWGTKDTLYRTERWIQMLLLLLQEFQSEHQIKELLDYQLAECYATISDVYLLEKDTNKASLFIAKALNASERFSHEWFTVNYVATRKELAAYRGNLLLRVQNAIKNPRRMLRRVFK